VTKPFETTVKGNWYNGYSPSERDKKFKELKKLIADGVLPPASGPCALCNDPDIPVEYHSEDYGEPYLWNPPAMYCLCRSCHRYKLHRRFWQHSYWQVHIAHVRRGGYSSDLKHAEIKKELSTYRYAIEQGKKFTLRQLRPYQNTPGLEWFANLRMDVTSLTYSNARVARESLLIEKFDDVMQLN
jgi:hypothetical protein